MTSLAAMPSASALQQLPEARHGRRPRDTRFGSSSVEYGRDAAYAVVWAVLLAVVIQWILGGGVSDLLNGIGPALSSIGRLAGPASSVFLLALVAMMARIPIVENAFGRVELIRIHRNLGIASFALLAAHIVAITLGYAAEASTGALAEAWDLMAHYPGMLLAAAGTLALLGIGLASWRPVRRRLRYETWHLLHLYAYLGAGLALPHQIWTGQEFQQNPWLAAAWWTVWGATVVAVIDFRVLLPLYLSWRHGLRVASVRTSGTATIVTLSGRKLDRWNIRAGQFLNWRFLDRHTSGAGWSRSHPYSLSAAPDGRTLEIAVAGDGDGARRMSRLAPGTRALIEGPYGRFHLGTTINRSLVLVGAGSGIAPLKALADEASQAGRRVDIIYRVHDADHAPLLAEINALSLRVGVRVHLLAGSRNPNPGSWVPWQFAHLTGAQALRTFVPDAAQCDVFACGPEEWTVAVRSAAISAGVECRAIHTESFGW